MPIKWRAWIRGALAALFDLALAVLLVGAVQILISLLVWPILFRRQPLGFSMALSLVGFASWGLAFMMSLGGRRRLPGVEASTPDPLAQVGREGTFVARVRDQMRRLGCGFLLVVSSLVPLTLAFLLRLQADLRAGLTLREILPPPP